MESPKLKAKQASPLARHGSSSMNGAEFLHRVVNFAGGSSVKLHFVGCGADAAESELCSHVVNLNSFIVVNDAYCHPLVRNSRAVTDWGLTSFVGAPIHAATGEIVAVAYQAKIHFHNWSDSEVLAVRSLAEKIESILLSVDIES